ncbi:MAG: endolytic transglycosylase MltG, partial [Longimicrobiales bacterium]|nr:endolytic transglycosylase MltG [Longimicrobiales bacterium]
MNSRHLKSTFLAILLVLNGCSSPPPGSLPEELTVPAGATFREVADTLHARGIITKPRLFRAYARLRGLDREVRSGEYAFLRPTSWSRILRDLTEGRVLTEALTVPEGFTLKQIAPRIAAITGMEEDSVLAEITAPSADLDWEVPGPGLEGYLFPDTYRFAPGAPL